MTIHMFSANFDGALYFSFIGQMFQMKTWDCVDFKTCENLHLSIISDKGMHNKLPLNIYFCQIIPRYIQLLKMNMDL